MGEPLPFSFLRSFLSSVPPSIAKLHTGKTDTRRACSLAHPLARSILLSEIMAEDWMAMAVVCNLLSMRMEGGKVPLSTRTHSER